MTAPAPAPATATATGAPHSEVDSSAAAETGPLSTDLTAGRERIEAGKARADAEIASWSASAPVRPCQR